MSFGRQTLGILIQLGTMILIARQLGPFGNGQFALAMITPAFACKLFGMGIGPSLVYHIGIKSIQVQEAVRFTFLLFTYASVIGLGFGIPTLIATHHMLFPQVSLKIIIIAYSLFPLLILSEAFACALQGKEDLKSYNLSLIIQPAITFSTILLTTFLSTLTVEKSILCLYIGHFASISFLYLSTRKYSIVGERISSKERMTKRISIISYGIRAQSSNILAIANKRIGLFMVNLFLSPNASGIYAIARQIPERLAIIPSSISSVILPRLAILHANNKKRLEITATSFRICVTLSTFAAIGIFVIGKPFINLLFGAEYTAAYVAMTLILPGFIAQNGSSILANAIAAKGRPGLNTIIAAITFVMIVISSLLLIPTKGILGASLAVTISSISSLIIRFFIISKGEPNFSALEFLPRFSDFSKLFPK